MDLDLDTVGDPDLNLDWSMSCGHTCTNGLNFSNLFQQRGSDHGRQDDSMNEKETVDKVLSGCSECFQEVLRVVRDQPNRFVFGEPGISSQSCFAGRLRRPLLSERRRMLKNGLTKGPAFATMYPFGHGPLALRFKPPVLSQNDWDTFAVMFNHLATEMERHHKSLCSLCTPSYHCDRMREPPVYLLTMESVDLISWLLSHSDQNMFSSAKGPTFFWYRLVIDGNYLSFVNAVLDQDSALSDSADVSPTRMPLRMLLERTRARWCRKTPNIQWCHTAQFMFATALDVVDRQRRLAAKELRSVLPSTVNGRTTAETLARQLGSLCHFSVAQKIMEVRRSVGANETYLLKRYGLLPLASQKPDVGSIRIRLSSGVAEVGVDVSWKFDLQEHDGLFHFSVRTAN
jgi:hypothetical protein